VQAQHTGTAVNLSSHCASDGCSGNHSYNLGSSPDSHRKSRHRAAAFPLPHPMLTEHTLGLQHTGREAVHP
jgi:hypothetical protein